MGGHRAAYTNGKNMPNYRHYRKREHTFDDAKASILEFVPQDVHIIAREALWMRKLHSFLPKGLNSLFSPTES